MFATKVLDTLQELDAAPSIRLVAAVLADYSDPEGTSFPLQTTLAERTGLSRKAVNEAIGWLCDHDLISKSFRVKVNGGDTFFYHFHPQLVPTPVTSGYKVEASVQAKKPTLVTSGYTEHSDNRVINKRDNSRFGVTSGYKGTETHKPDKMTLEQKELRKGSSLFSSKLAQSL